MNIYYISQNVNNEWDTYESAVVAAPDENTARNMHPSGDDDYTTEMWCEPKDVIVKYLGEAAEGIAQGVICAEFS